jgi:hypothetical protein
MRAMKTPLHLAVAVMMAATLAGPADAVLAPEYYEEARRTAPNHVQIELKSVAGPDGGLGACAVEGVVIRSFRGTLAPDEAISFAVSCYDYGEIPAGGTLWTDYDALKVARYLEAFMSDDRPPRILLDQVEIILAPRDRPYCDSNTLYCESTVESAPIPEECGIAARIWNWLGLGAEECS